MNGLKKLIVGIFILIIVAGAAEAVQPSDRLLAALIQKESGGNDKAKGDMIGGIYHAFGCLQIWQKVCDDVNAACGTHYVNTDCQGNRQLSVWLCRKYISLYATFSHLGHVPTDRDIATIWNGGPSGCFKDGALDRFGHKPKSALARAHLKRQQARAARYWQDLQRFLR